MASGAHKIGRLDFNNLPLKKGYSVFAAYGRAKLCNVLFTRELVRRLKQQGKGTTANCVHPGTVASNMGVDRDTGFGRTIIRLLRPFFLTPEQGARTAIYVATSPQVTDISGAYFYKCRIAKTSKRAQDADLARRLWQVSEEIVQPHSQ